MSDLRTQLRDYVESNIERLNVEDIVPGFDLSPGLVRTRRSLRPRLVAVLSTVAVFVLIGGAALLLRPSADQQLVVTDPPQPQPTTAPQPEPTVAPQPEPAPEATASTTTLPPVPSRLEMTWQRVPHHPSLERAWMTALATDGSRLVAVGSAEDTTAAVWASDDGVSWQRVTDRVFQGRPAADGEGFAGPFSVDVAAGPLGFVVVGHEGGPLEETGYDAAVWISIDGSSWSRVTDPAGVFSGPGNQGMGAVTYLGDRLVAVGVSDGRVAAWVSDDGQQWQAVDDADLTESPEGAWIADIAAGPSGIVAAGGYLDNKHHAAVWVSPDGLSWQRVPDDDIADVQGPGADETMYPRGAHMTHVSGTADGYVAFGFSSSFRGVWRSEDGSSWIPVDRFVTPIPNKLFFIVESTATGDRSVAVGWEPRNQQPPHENYADFWASDNDGTTWYRVGHLDGVDRRVMVGGENPPLFPVEDVVGFGSGFVAVGHNGVYLDYVDESLGANECGSLIEESCRTDAAVWIGEWASG